MTFMKEIQLEFVPSDYKQRLKWELRQRTQHPQESLYHFIRVISEYYDRIREDVLDDAKVSTARRVMHPQFQDLAENMQFKNLQAMAKAPGVLMDKGWRCLGYKLPLPSQAATRGLKTSRLSNTPHRMQFRCFGTHLATAIFGPTMDIPKPQHTQPN